MKKLRIALDVDGVLANFIAGALGVVEEVTGRRYAEADVTLWDYTKALNLSPTEGGAVKAAIGARRGFAESLEPYPEALQGVRRLREWGDVFCVTSPWESNPWWRAEREAWCLQHFGIGAVHHAHDKTGYEADIFVDDKPAHVSAWKAAWPHRTAVFLRSPCKAEEVPQGAHGMYSWDEICALAREVACSPARPSFPLGEKSR